MVFLGIWKRFKGNLYSLDILQKKWRVYETSSGIFGCQFI